MRMLHILKIAGKITLIVLLCLFTAGALVGFFYEKEIKQLIISEINRNINTKISVGEFDFSVIRHFPNASFEMKDVKIDEVTVSEKKDTLLFAKQLSLRFRITDLFEKNVSVRKIVIHDGIINIRVDREGHGNYLFWKKSADTTGSGAIDLEKIGLRNVVLNYNDEKDHQDYSMLATDGDLSGKFSGDEFWLKTNAKLFVNRLRIHDENYVDHKPVILMSSLYVNSKNGLYRIDDSQVKVDRVQFNVGGEISNKSADWVLNLAISAEENDIPYFQKILPPSFAKQLGNIESRGKLLFFSEIKGSVAGKNIPHVDIGFTVKNGRLLSGDAELEKLNFSGKFTNHGKIKGNTIDIPALTAYLSGHKIEAGIRLDNLPEAFLTLNAKTQLNLKEIQPFIKADTLQSISGDLAMNVFYSGKIRELSRLNKGELNNIKASGNIDISHVNFKLKNNPLEFGNLSGNFSLHNNDVYVKNFTGNISSSDFSMDGVFRNFISFLLIPGQPGDLQARVTSKTVDLDELLVNKSEKNSGDTSYILKFNPRLICGLDVNIENLRFRRFTADNIHGHVNLNKQVISGKGLQFNAMGGNVTMDARINASRRDSVMMDYDTKFSKVDITRLFYEMENFDQHTMTDANVKGRLSADVQFVSAWSNDLILNSKSVRASCDITVENGELINFAPIQAVGKYIHSPDLKHIRFSTLKNNISIANRKIYIPKMDINSSAMNISGNGTHDFDNNIDYHLQLLLSDVLGKKAKSSSTEFGEIADDGLGRTKLFLAMRGTVDDPHFAYDRKATGEKLKNDIAVEKQNLKGLLKKEFGLYKNEPSVQASKPKKHEEMQIDWSNE